MSIFKRALALFRKTQFTCEEILPPSFDYERTVYRVILPRIMSTLEDETAYLDTWIFHKATEKKLEVLAYMMRKAIAEITGDESCHTDVTVCENRMFINVPKASIFTLYRIEKYRSRLPAKQNSIHASTRLYKEKLAVERELKKDSFIPIKLDIEDNWSDDIKSSISSMLGSDHPRYALVESYAPYAKYGIIRKAKKSRNSSRTGSKASSSISSFYNTTDKVLPPAPPSSPLLDITSEYSEISSVFSSATLQTQDWTYNDVYTPIDEKEDKQYAEFMLMPLPCGYNDYTNYLKYINNRDAIESY